MQCHCQQLSDLDNPAVLSLVTQLVYSQISNLTSLLTHHINSRSTFCVKHLDADWDKAFNFSSDLGFVASCVQKTKGDITQRLCTAAEVMFYLNSLFERSTSVSYLKLNKNCNLTSWVSGCEPGWACSVLSSQQVDLRNSQEMPARTTNCQPCCEGFFCPHGVTCMIPCPLGSYCPLATLKASITQLVYVNHIFINCLQSSQTIPVEEKIFGLMLVAVVRHCCRMGSTSEKRCFKLSSCNSNAVTQIYVHIELCSLERRMAKSKEAVASSVRKTTNAHQRWKAAKDAAKKGASGLQAQLSKTFSCKKDVTDPEEVKILSQSTTEQILNCFHICILLLQAWLQIHLQCQRKKEKNPVI